MAAFAGPEDPAKVGKVEDTASEVTETADAGELLLDGTAGGLDDACERGDTGKTGEWEVNAGELDDTEEPGEPEEVAEPGEPEDTEKSAEAEDKREPGDLEGIPGDLVGAAGELEGIPGDLVGAAGELEGIPGDLVGAAGELEGIPGDLEGAAGERDIVDFKEAGPPELPRGVGEEAVVRDVLDSGVETLVAAVVFLPRRVVDLCVWSCGRGLGVALTVVGFAAGFGVVGVGVVGVVAVVCVVECVVVV